ncbi:MAG: NAD(P)/FAD-dependent oxidoreductase, partial [Pseudorhodoplanes sp.]
MQVLVIGAGVVGLAVARAAAVSGHDVIVAEASDGIGTGISSRNSEVIHAGMYYPTGTLRARLCPRGNRMLYEFCESHGVAHRRCSKLIVATSEAERARIESIHSQGVTNGVEGLELIGGNAARAMEPELSCVAALVSPSTGIIDGHGYMLALQGDLEARDGAIAFETPVTSIEPMPSGFRVSFGGTEPGQFEVDAVVNCAGLSAQKVAATIHGYPASLIPKQVLAKGNSFAYAGRPAFTRLIYPTPVDGGLGVHVTLDLAGRMRFGPDVEWIEQENYDVDPKRAASFYARIRTYWPGLPEGALVPDYAGIRPKLTG